MLGIYLGKTHGLIRNQLRKSSRLIKAEDATFDETEYPRETQKSRWVSKNKTTSINMKETTRNIIQMTYATKKSSQEHNVSMTWLCKLKETNLTPSQSWLPTMKVRLVLSKTIHDDGKNLRTGCSTLLEAWTARTDTLHRQRDRNRKACRWTNYTGGVNKTGYERVDIGNENRNRDSV